MDRQKPNIGNVYIFDDWHTIFLIIFHLVAVDGLLNASFIPDKARRELRELVSYRKSLVPDKNRELNRLQKLLEGANIKLSDTVSAIGGKNRPRRCWRISRG